MKQGKQGQRGASGPPELLVMMDAARRAGAGLMRRYRSRSRLVVEEKGRADFVSEADRQAERAIVACLGKAFPAYGLVTEESAPRRLAAAARFVIDPLDGTTNFLHGIPHFDVSIALQVDGRIEAGVVFSPAQDEMFFAARGRGAWLGKARLKVTPDRTFSRALVSTGIPHSSGRVRHARYLPMLEQVMWHAAGVRRMGAAALDLAYVAAGRCAVFFEMGLKTWDMAAGALIVEEAGGRVSDLDGRATYLESGEILATNGRLHARTLAMLRGSASAARSARTRLPP
jgi:myo-inositol-1(or 4)-monophosphatase